MQNQGLTEDSKEVKQLKYDVICLLKQLSKSLDSQIEALSEMISALRSGYCKYLNLRYAFKDLLFVAVFACF